MMECVDLCRRADAFAVINSGWKTMIRMVLKAPQTPAAAAVILLLLQQVNTKIEAVRAAALQENVKDKFGI